MKIGLCIIVKNEAHIIERCLASVMLLVDYVLIVDTGSIDGTQEVAANYLSSQGMKYTIVDEPWQDFAFNRTQAISLLNTCIDIDYGLMIDADEVLVINPELDIAKWKESLDKDLYYITTMYEGITYVRPQLFSNKVAYSYKGVLHEYLVADNAKTRELVTDIINTPIQDGARAKNPEKYADDAKVFEAVLKTETDPFLISRYTFYLGQSYKDCGNDTLAIKAYSARVTLGGWVEELYISLLTIARLKEKCVYPYPTDLVIQAFMEAHELLPTRAEAIHDAIKYCRLNNRYNQGYALAKHALSMQYPIDALFSEKWIYDYGIMDEFAIVAYWTKQYEESKNACITLLANPNTPVDYHDRIIANLAFATTELNVLTK